MLQKILRTNIFIILILIIAGCSSNPASLDRKHLKTNKVSTVNLTSPNKLSYELSNSGSASTGAFGLVGALVGASVDAVVNSRREKGMLPIVAALGNFNTRQIFAGKLRKLSGISFKNGVGVKSSIKDLKSGLNVLGVKANYILSATHQYVTVNASTTLKTSEKAENYVRNFTATKNIDFNLGKNEKTNATQFLINNPNILKSAINAAMDNIVQQISTDINIGEVQ